jgi:hypothetical protein
MVTGIVHANRASPNFVGNEDVFCNLQCQSCSLMKSDFQAFVNEIKSMTEIISILKELKYHSVTSQERKPNTCTSKPSIDSQHCSKCSELETQLKDTLSELSSVQLITEILNKEIKVLKQTSHNDSNTTSPWIDARSMSPRSPTIVQPPKEVHTTYGNPVACQYALPVANLFDTLSNRHESQEPRDTIFPSKFKQSAKLVPSNIHEHIKGLHRKKIPAVNQHRRPTLHQRNEPNLQEQSTNKDGASFIPTVVNGVTNVNPTSVTVPKYIDSTRNLIKNLRETINAQNKKRCSHLKKHRIVLIGDSHIKGYACNLKPVVSNNYDLYSTVKPGSTTSELKESAKEEVSQLSHDDLIIICSGTNDYELNEFSLTFQNIMDFIKSNNHMNIILMNVPFRYDLHNSI